GSPCAESESPGNLQLPRDRRALPRVALALHLDLQDGTHRLHTAEGVVHEVEPRAGLVIWSIFGARACCHAHYRAALSNHLRDQVDDVVSAAKRLQSRKPWDHREIRGEWPSGGPRGP